METIDDSSQPLDAWFGVYVDRSAGDRSRGPDHSVFRSNGEPGDRTTISRRRVTDGTWGDTSGVSVAGLRTFLMYDLQPAGANEDSTAAVRHRSAIPASSGPRRIDRDQR